MPKTIILMRHGEDGPKSKKLTELGIGQNASVSQQLLAAGIIPDLIETSPSVRTQQAASLAIKTYANVGKKISEAVIDPNLRDGDILTAINALSNEQTVLMVSHEAKIASAVKSLTGMTRTVNHAHAFVIEIPEWNVAAKSCTGRIMQEFRPKYAVRHPDLPDTTWPPRRVKPVAFNR